MLKCFQAALVGIAVIFLSAPGQAQGGPPKWSVGAVGIYGTSPFALEDGEFNAFPYISYNGDRFFIQGLQMGYHLLKPADDVPLAFSLDLVGAARMLPGSSRNKVTADAGVRFGLEGTFGKLTVSGLHDATGTSGGMELQAAYSYTFRSDKLDFTPRVGVSWQDQDLTNYLWGTTPEQQARMIEKEKAVILPVFQPNTKALNLEAGVMAIYKLSGSVSLISLVNAIYLDKDIRVSPAIDKDYQLSVALGLSYNF